MDHIHYWSVGVVLEMLPHWLPGSKYGLKKKSQGGKKKGWKHFMEMLFMEHFQLCVCPCYTSKRSPYSAVRWCSCKTGLQLCFLLPFSQKVSMPALTSWAMGLQRETAVEDLGPMLRATCCTLGHGDLLRAAAQALLCTAQDTQQQQYLGLNLGNAVIVECGKSSLKQTLLKVRR